MDFLFYLIIALLVLVFPIFVQLEGAFSYDRKNAFAVISLYGIKVLSVKIVFDDNQGVLLYVNGKEKLKNAKKFDQKKNVDVGVLYKTMLSAIYLRKVDVDLYAGGEPQTISLLLSSFRIFIFGLLSQVNAYRAIDETKVRILPCYVNDQLTVKFSIAVLTAPALIFFALAHTIVGKKYAKRSNRKFDE